MATSKKCGVGSPSVQPHIQRGRLEFKKIIEEGKLMQDAPRVTPGGELVLPKLSLKDGLVTIPLTRTIKRWEMRNATFLFAGDPDGSRESYIESNEKAKKRGVKDPENTNAIGQFQLLVKTSKMGAYSFNLPAGPASLNSLGTCPISAMHWPISRCHVGEPDLVPGSELPPTAIKVDLNELPVVREQEKDWICADCYAMKGNYGNPSMIIGGELKRQFVEKYGELEKHKKGLGSRCLADVLEMSIRWGQVKSIRALQNLKGQIDKDTGLELSVFVQRPEYFRIHDAGDFGLGDWYVEAWFDVARRLSKQHHVRIPEKVTVRTPVEWIYHGATSGEMMTLPPVTLWAATRAWGVNKGLQKRMVSGDSGPQGKNLVVRPSALYFGDKPPSLNGQKIEIGNRRFKVAGYAQGSSGDCLDKGVEMLGDFVCPAYTPLDPSKPRVVPGACLLSRGLGWESDPNALPAPLGKGCRVCWDHPDKSVVYVRH